MGQKYSTSTSHWTMDDWAFGMADNVVPVDDVTEEMSKLPMKYFGSQVIENDPSIQQMQRDLLSFDDKLKRLLFWRKKKRRSKTENYIEEEYDVEDEQYYNGYPQSIPEEEEPPLSPIYSEPRITRRPSWKCKTCATKNKSTDIQCRQCRENQTEF